MSKEIKKITADGKYATRTAFLAAKTHNHTASTLLADSSVSESLPPATLLPILLSQFHISLNAIHANAIASIKMQRRTTSNLLKIWKTLVG